MRRRSAAFALLALLALVAGLVWLALRDGAPGDDRLSVTAETSAGDESGPDTQTRPRARAAAPADVATTAVSAASGEPAQVDGWPAADVIVRRADGTPVHGALVYVLPAGKPSPANLGLVPRSRTWPDGRMRFAVPAAGRFDVGATGDVFESVVRDVEFPAREPVEIVLPDLVPLEVRKEREVPAGGWVTIARAEAERIAANPGRSESRYVGGSVEDIGAHVLVPRGVPMRVRTAGGVVAAPAVVTAPGPVTLRPDGRREVDVDFVFVPAPDLATRWFQFTFAFERVPGDPDSIDEGIVHLRPAPHANSVRAKLRCPPALTTVRWRCSGDPIAPMQRAALDASAIPPERVHRIEVPVALGDFQASGFRVVAPDGEPLREVRVLTSRGRLFHDEQIMAGREHWFEDPFDVLYARGEVAAHVEARITAYARTDGGWLAASVVHVAPGRVVDLTLVPGAQVRVRWRRPAALDPAWPLGVSLVASPRLSDLLVEEPSPALVPVAQLLEESAVLGPFPAGDVELVFRFGGREVGRRTVHVVPGPTIDVEAPEILPPGR